MSYSAHTPEDREQMLSAIGEPSLQRLLRTIPDKLQLKEPLPIDPSLSEAEVYVLLDALADKNASANHTLSFLGGGIYDHYVPAAVDALSSRSEFYTAYTPYQAEVAQGTLQTTYEFQSMVCRLTGMDIANASLYDGGSAVAEAASMALGITKRPQVIVSGTVNPRYRDILQTYTQGRDMVMDVTLEERGVSDVRTITKLISDQTACVIVQSPNFFGQLEDVREIERAIHEAGGLLIYVFYPTALGLCQSPGEINADIAVGEGQCLGNTPSFGGPLLGLIAAKKSHSRFMPGRIVGRTEDVEGRTGYVLTLQTREQHIRREKATSNICTSQALLATRAAIYLALLGKQGFAALAEVCTRRAHYLADAIDALRSYTRKYPGPFFNEFVITCPIPAARVCESMLENGIMPGIDLSRYYPDRENELMISVTEKHTREHLDHFVSVLSQIGS